MPKYRRVTKQEDYAAWKARKYTTSGAGKFGKRSKVISFRQFQQKQHGGKTIEKQIAERLATKGRSPQSIKSLQTRHHRKVLSELQIHAAMRKQHDIYGVSDDDKVIKKFTMKGYKKLSRREKEIFHGLFYNYEPDIVRGWLGSDEQSRASRKQWDHQESWRLPPGWEASA